MNRLSVILFQRVSVGVERPMIGTAVDLSWLAVLLGLWQLTGFFWWVVAFVPVYYWSLWRFHNPAQWLT